MHGINGTPQTFKHIIKDLDTTNYQVLLFYISISTPWAGHDGAKLGLEYAPDIIPVWNDIWSRESISTKSFQKKYKQDIEHYLLFGFKGASLMMGENNDGVVSLKSQLREEAQDQASAIKGFNEGHMSILENKKLINLINSTLNGEI